MLSFIHSCAYSDNQPGYYVGYERAMRVGGMQDEEYMDMRGSSDGESRENADMPGYLPMNRPAKKVPSRLIFSASGTITHLNELISPIYLLIV